MCLCVLCVHVCVLSVYVCACVICVYKHKEQRSDEHTLGQELCYLAVQCELVITLASSDELLESPVISLDKPLPSNSASETHMSGRNE